jgi:hypothetical protein
MQSIAIVRASLVAWSLAAVGATHADPATAPDQAPPPVTPVATKQPATTQDTTQPPAPKEDEKIVCKRIDPPTGSRAGAKKVCKTAADWRREREASKEVIDDVQDKGRTWNPPGG